MDRIGSIQRDEDEGAMEKGVTLRTMEDRLDVDLVEANAAAWAH
jgi:hypothetical protein